MVETMLLDSNKINVMIIEQMFLWCQKGLIILDRVILHSDLNNFYASVECLHRIEIRNKPVAVCGDPDARHGIVLAKNYLAKATGIQTGEAVWQAKQKCPGLVVVPPNFPLYLKYSRLARSIYASYTDQVEPFGLDEAWLDVAGSYHIHGDGTKIANEIRERIKFEMGVTASVGVSYNKIFAKLGSDLKKPDPLLMANSNFLKNTIR
jgi:DNA polymerase-4